MARTSRTPKATRPPYIPHIHRTTVYGIYEIESQTTPGTFHRTDALTEVCSCRAGQFGKRCHHVPLAIGVWEMYRKLATAAAARQRQAASAA